MSKKKGNMFIYFPKSLLFSIFILIIFKKNKKKISIKKKMQYLIIVFKHFINLNNLTFDSGKTINDIHLHFYLSSTYKYSNFRA